MLAPLLPLVGQEIFLSCAFAMICRGCPDDMILGFVDIRGIQLLSFGFPWIYDDHYAVSCEYSLTSKVHAHYLLFMHVSNRFGSHLVGIKYS